MDKKAYLQELRAKHLSGAEMIFAERIRHLKEEGFFPAHDDQWIHGELAKAALCYLVFTITKSAFFMNVKHEFWPWAPEWWKPDTNIRNLVKAGSLIAAEIDRIKRLQMESTDAKDD
jgi:hypothetical protein